MGAYFRTGSKGTTTTNTNRRINQTKTEFEILIEALQEERIAHEEFITAEKKWNTEKAKIKQIISNLTPETRSLIRELLLDRDMIDNNTNQYTKKTNNKI